MYAIVEIGGHQYKVSNGDEIFVNRLQGGAGDTVSFENVLLVDNDGAISVGTPTVSGAAIGATIVEHLRGDKVIVFKKKRRKGYRVKNGHRDHLTKIKIDSIA